MVEFLMHFMVFDILDIDRTERAKTDMQGYKGKMNTHILEFLHLLFGEVESCRRCGGRAFLPIIYRLVSLFVLQFFVDVRRQGGLTETIEDFLKNTFIMEFHHTTTEVCMFRYNAGKFITEIDDIADLRFFAGFYECLPMVGIQAAQQENFHLATCLIAMADQARRHDARIVENQGIPWYNIFF